MTPKGKDEDKMGYGDEINKATGEGRFPFFSEEGRYVCAIAGWKGKETRNQGFADFCDFKILKSTNPNVPVDTHRTRMRAFKGDAAGPAAEEVKQRALVAYASKGFPMTASQVTSAVMEKISENDGGPLKGAYIVVEIGAKIGTKRPGVQFSPANYFVPTKADLEGLEG
jgi:hypothetical protein